MMKCLCIAPLPGAAVALLFATLATAQADPGVKSLQPYTARYQVTYRGLNGGEIEASFKPAPWPINGSMKHAPFRACSGVLP